jgi:hypothetical protein
MKLSFEDHSYINERFYLLHTLFSKKMHSTCHVPCTKNFVDKGEANLQRIMALNYKIECKYASNFLEIFTIIKIKRSQFKV